MAKTPHEIYLEVNGKAFDVDGYYGAQCLKKGTLVSLSNGICKPIEKLEIGEELKGGNRVVSNQPQKAKLLRITTDLGTFDVTPSHRFIAPDGSDFMAKEAKIGDVIQLDRNEPKKEHQLTEDELRFFGFYLADGTKKYRWKNSYNPEIKITIGTLAKEDYLDTINVSTHKRLHSNGTAKTYTLVNKKHPELLKLIHGIDGKYCPMSFTKDEYQFIIEGYLMGDGYRKHNSIVATSVDKALLVSIQFGCILNGWRAKLSKPILRDCTNLCDNPKPIYHLTINKNKNPQGKITNIEKVKDDMVYVLNTDGDHTYFAENHKHHNCWDGVMYVNRTYWGGQVRHCGGDGYVYNLWTYRKTNGILNDFIEVPITQAQDGDVFIWNKGAPECPLSHIAIFRKWDNTGKTRATFLGQNQGGPAGAFDQRSISVSGVLGVLRPKCYANTSSSGINWIAENGTATFTHNYIKIRKDNPDGEVVPNLYYMAGQSVNYVAKCAYKGHRWIRYKRSNGEYGCVAVSGSEKQGVDPWATFK